MGDARSLLQAVRTKRSVSGCNSALPPVNRPLLFGLSSMNPDGSEQQFEASAEPNFGDGCRFAGFRGVGVERRESPSHSYSSTLDRSDASLLFTRNRTMCDCEQIESFLQCMMCAGIRSLPGRVLAVLGSVTSCTHRAFFSSAAVDVSRLNPETGAYDRRSLDHNCQHLCAEQQILRGLDAVYGETRPKAKTADSPYEMAV